jgi:hypothetical protein
MVLPDVPFHPAHVQPQVGQNDYLQNGAYSLQWSIKPITVNGTPKKPQMTVKRRAWIVSGSILP